MPWSFSIDGIFKAFKESRVRRQQHIFEYLDEIAQAAEKLSSVWLQICRELETGALNPHHSAEAKVVGGFLDRSVKKLAISVDQKHVLRDFGMSQSVAFCDLDALYRSLSVATNGNVPQEQADRINHALGETLRTRMLLREYFDALLDGKKSVPEIPPKELGNVLEILVHDTAELKAAILSVKARIAS